MKLVLVKNSYIYALILNNKLKNVSINFMIIIQFLICSFYKFVYKQKSMRKFGCVFVVANTNSSVVWHVI